MEGHIILHETMHELYKKNLNGVILKIDFEKTYDKPKWPFLQQNLIFDGSVGIKANDVVGPYF